MEVLRGSSGWKVIVEFGGVLACGTPVAIGGGVKRATRYHEGFSRVGPRRQVILPHTRLGERATTNGCGLCDG